MTTALCRSSSSRAVVFVVFAAACADERPGVSGTTSLRIEVTSPADLGSKQAPLDQTARALTVDITALDAKGQPDPTLEIPVHVYVQFLGSLTPDPHLGPSEIAVDLVAGQARGVTLTLARAFGPTFLWVEDASREGATFATGTSPTLWYRDPYVDDISRPLDEAAATALSTSPLEGKQVLISASRHGTSGRLVVTGVYAQGYTLSDVSCAAAPCKAAAYGHIYVYTYGRPRAEDGTALELGHRLAWVAGGVSEFNGYTEVGFSQSALAEATPYLEDLPEPVVIDPAWLSDSLIELERLESGLVAVEEAIVCAPDGDYEKYGQWKLNLGSGCGKEAKPMNVVTRGTVAGFDPVPLVGQALPRVVGTLRAVNIGKFNVWIMQPRSRSDITL